MCTCSADLCGIPLCSSAPQNSPVASYEKSSERFLGRLLLLSPRIPRARLKKWKGNQRSVSRTSHSLLKRPTDMFL
ncbi:hypothetical protein CEXT_210751 [Caerostris extrusa]|uniref:Uncharacterized protein n=1 Tax=Caerostris extrusa TaxID=172846 RepID=A0AAV4XM84_CAEEX|nr:hypothetical protein CEXT_210751 [Caerostris extrusa]